VRQTAIAILAGLSLSACAAGRPYVTPVPTCFNWSYWLKYGLIRPGLDRSAVQRACQHFEIPQSSSEKALCGSGPVDQRWECLVEDYKCDRGDLAPGTVRVFYKLKEGPSAGPAEPHDVPGHVWVVSSCGFQEAEDPHPPLPPPDTPKPAR
jgi:hypothetical protein